MLCDLGWISEMKTLHCLPRCSVTVQVSCSSSVESLPSLVCLLEESEEEMREEEVGEEQMQAEEELVQLSL